MANFDIYKRGFFAYAPDDSGGGSQASGSQASGSDSGELVFNPEGGAGEPVDPLRDEGFVLEDEPILFDAPGTEGSQDSGSQASGEEGGAQASAFEVKDGKLVFGEDSLSPEELKDFLDKGKDYTRKTQELASQRAAIAPAIEFAKFVDQLPPAAVEELALLARKIDQGVKSGTYMPGGQMQTPALPSDPNAAFELGGVKINPADFDDGGKLLIGALRQVVAQNAQLAQAYQHVNGQLVEVKKTLPQVQSALQSVQGDKDAAAAAAKIKSDWGATVDPAQLRQLSQQTGIPDMEAAWLKANGAQIRQGAFNQGHAQGARPKPKTPAGGAKVFDPNDTNMTADGVMRALASGATPLPGAGVKK